MVRKYENTHCGINGIGSLPFIPLMPTKNKYLEKDNKKFDREKQKAYRDVSKFFVKK